MNKNFFFLLLSGFSQYWCVFIGSDYVSFNFGAFLKFVGKSRIQDGGCKMAIINLVPRFSPFHVPGSERGETLVGSGHVSPRQKIRPRDGSSTCYFWSRFIVHSETRLPLCCAKPTRNSFNWLFFNSLHFASHCNINRKA